MAIGGRADMTKLLIVLHRAWYDTFGDAWLLLVIEWAQLRRMRRR